MFTINNFNLPVDQARQKKTGQEVYFEGSKKNQLNQIKNYMKTIVSDPEKAFYRKQLIKKIISYTTSGIDTSRLYPQIVLASATKDIIQKKLIYLYLSIYSSANQNFARMAINTFIKDCNSPNPNIRALAIRHLSNLKFKGREEYTYPILLQGLKDFNPLVKKSCIMGLTKLIIEKNRFLEDPVRDEQLLNQFYEMIRQNDSNLVCTVIEAINQIQTDGISMSKKLVNYLLGNLANFGDFQLPIILHYVQLFDPKTDEEIINILSILETRLKSSSASVSLAISKIYLKMAKIKSNLKEKIIDAVKSTLLTFINNETPEIQYIVLQHIQYIIQAFHAENFCSDFKKFMIGGSQPTYLKKIKIKILELCSGKNNMADIINEFAEYLIDQDICKSTMDSFSVILFRSEDNDSKFIIKTLINAIQNIQNSVLCNSSLPLIRNYLRKYPNDFPMFQNIFYTLAKHANQNESKCALIEIIGDYGDMIEDAIEMIAYKDDISSDSLKISLLRANVKMFYKRSHQMIQILPQIFKKIINSDEIHLHVKDYAVFLMRSLESGVEEFKESFMNCRTEIKRTEKRYDQLQFNTLEIVYRSKQQKWIIDKHKYFEVPEELEIEKININEEIGEQSQRQQIAARRQININFESKFKKLEADNFDVTFSLLAQQFEANWQQFEIGSSITRILVNAQVLNQQNLEELFKAWNIIMIASAESQEEIKVYYYCKVIEVTGDLGVACIQLCIHKLPQTLTLLIKSDNEELAGFVSRYIEEFLKINQII